MYKNEVYLEDNNYRKVEITCYLDGDEGELTLTALSNTYFKSLAIACETLDKTTIKGSITSSAESLMEQPLLQPIRQQNFPIRV